MPSHVLPHTRRVLIADADSQRRRHLYRKLQPIFGKDLFIAASGKPKFLTELRETCPDFLLLSSDHSQQVREAALSYCRANNCILVHIPKKLSEGSFDQVTDIPSFKAACSSLLVNETCSVKPDMSPKTEARNLLLLGASTGGVEALLEILGAFDATCPPTLVVQHTGRTFGQGLADLLARHSSARVRLAEDNLRLERGMIVLSAGVPAHVVLASHNRIKLERSDPVSGHRPSIDRLFTSACPFAQQVTAALLTGMGQDGAVGLAKLRDAGAITIAQDEETSVVYGMPRVAAQLNAAKFILPLHQISSVMLGQSLSNHGDRS